MRLSHGESPGPRPCIHSDQYQRPRCAVIPVIPEPWTATVEDKGREEGRTTGEAKALEEHARDERDDLLRSCGLCGQSWYSYPLLAVSALDTLVSNPIGNWDLLLVMDGYTPSLPKKYALTL